MNDCGCFYCKECNHDSSIEGQEDNDCVACGNKKKNSFDIRDKK
jgi:hypothetical protein